MKTWILIIFPLILVSAAYADVERVTLFNEQSFLFDGKNVTLINSNDDSIIVCVNREKTIISNEKTVNGVIVERTDSNEGSAKLRLDFECRDDCSCDGNECNNNACFITRESSTSTTSETIETSVEGNEETTTVTGLENVTGSAINEPSTDTSLKTVTYSLFGLAAILGIVAYFRKKGGEDNTLNNLEKEFSEEF